MKVVVIIAAVIVLFLIVESITANLTQRYKYNHIEVGDQICVEYSVSDYFDDVVIEATAEVVQVIKTEEGNVEEIVLDTGVHIHSYEELKGLGWFIF